MNNKIYIGPKGGKYYIKNGKKIYLKSHKKTNNYFKINLLNISAGLQHQLHNFRIIIKYCYKNNLKLIKPIFKLHGKHNNNKIIISDLSKYFNLNKITINGEKFKLYNDIKNMKYTIDDKYKNEDILLDTYYPMFSNLSGSVKLSYNKEISNIASKISSFFKNDYMCIHVRRGDRIINEQMNNDTKPYNR